MKAILPFLLLGLLLLVSLPGATSLQHEYLVYDSSNYALTQLGSQDVVNLQLLHVVQIKIVNPNATLWSVQNIQARSGPSATWTALSGYKTTHSGSSNPYALFRAASSGSPLNVDLSSLGYTQYMFEARPSGSPTWEQVVFYVTASSATMCPLTQAGSTSSEVCQNGATCVPDLFGSFCQCPVQFAGADCSECAETFTGAGCSECIEGHFGPSCEACPLCVNGTCAEGISADGSCDCQPGFAGDLCTECVTGFGGVTCAECSFGYHGAGCAACPDCGPYGSCNDGLAGNGTCTCDANWASANGGHCNVCAPGYYGEECIICPSCGHGVCNDGLTGTGGCTCQSGWMSFFGGSCTACAPGFYGASCQACPSCGANGVCDEGVYGDAGGTGECVCSAGWISSGGTCNTCAPGFFGPSCAPCADCGAHGTCNDGFGGSGICACQVGWESGAGVCDSCASGFFGANCTACPSCGSKGSCDEGVAGDVGGTGQCVCQAGWVSFGAGTCNACADNHFGSLCQACPDCGHGNCSQGVAGDTGGTGLCACNVGWGNSATGYCRECQSGYFGPGCAACPANCGTHGTCSDGLLGSGSCVCAPNFISYGGGFCNACADGFYGPRCVACPTCGGGGVCDQGVPGDLGGTGACVCAHGWMSGTGYCDICSPGFTGANCSQCLAGHFGVSCTECQDCGAKGVCRDQITGDGECVCADGWISNGGSCNVCHPSRTGPNCDVCAEGFYGSDCTACADCLRGTCFDGLLGDGTCSCEDGFALTPAGVCGACVDGHFGPDCLACPDCGGRGTCNGGISGSGVCNCPVNWASTPAYACSICAPGYYGRDCVRCPVCGPKGVCDEGLTQTGTCNCDMGWTSSQGSFCNVCQTGFTGANCTQCVAGTYPNCFNPVPCPNGCTGHGQCNLRTGVCTCDPRFGRTDCGACMVQSDTYPACSRPTNCPSDCSANGYCDYATGNCTCNAGFTPPSCDSCLPGFTAFPLCYPLMECSAPCDNGACNNRTGQCDCPANFAGPTCSECASGFESPAEGCYPIQSCIDNCNGRGDCNHFNGTCNCDVSYYGPACESQLYCFINPCQNGGTCTPTAHYYECECDPDHAGEDCKYWNLTPAVASISPPSSSWDGGSLVVTGFDFEAPLTVIFTYNSFRHEVVVNDFQVTTKRSASMSFELTFPDVDFVGYVLITIVNPSGDSVTFEDFYVTDVCPTAGQYAFNGTCTACPATATCPGGLRLWPLPGYWAADEFSTPYGCPIPSSRCLGGRSSECAVGYRGELCRFCAEGYQTDATGACVACPRSGCFATRPLSTSVYFLFIWMGVILVLAIAYTGIRIRNQKLLKKKQVNVNPRKEARLSRRLSRGISIPLKLSDYSQVDTDLAAPSPFSPHAVDDDSSEENVPLARSPRSGTPRSLQAIGKKATFSLPSTFSDPVATATSINNDVEAIILDRTIRTAPSKESLYNQVLKTSQPDLTLARMASQVTKQIMKSHQKEIMIFDDKGKPVGLVDELEIQKLIEKHIDSVSWRVVGQVNALSKGFAQTPQQRHPFDLPYFVQLAEELGTRPTAHNRWIAQLYANELVGMGLHPNISILGIYSGFGGSQTADYVARHLHLNLLRNENFKRNPYTAFVEAFLQTDEGYSQIVKKGNLSDIVGSTATVCMIRGYELWLAWVGNCRAVIFKSTGEVIDFCEPQTPDRDSERDRLEGRGGVIKTVNGQARLNGVYPISRAFGCPRMKNYLIPEPEIVTYDLQGDEEYLVIASNAFWEVVRDDDLAEILSEYQGEHVAGIADSLAAYARSLGVMENIVVSVTGFAES